MLKAVDRLARLHGLNQDAVKVKQQEAAFNINLGYTAEEIEALTAHSVPNKIASISRQPNTKYESKGSSYSQAISVKRKKNLSSDSYPDLAMLISVAIVRIETLDENHKVLSRASGFLFDESDFLSLYTCWHVVTGADPNNLPIKEPVKRKYLRVYSKIITSQQSHLTIDGEQYIDLELYSSCNKYLWIQGRPQNAVDEGAHLPVPHYDCVRININKHRDKFRIAFQQQNVASSRLQVGSDAFIAGYPFGYSASDAGPSPIFLKRSQASAVQNTQRQLLDAAGSPCMSGGPLLIKSGQDWLLVGIYTGAKFPEAKYFSKELDKNNNKVSFH